MGIKRFKKNRLRNVIVLYKQVYLLQKFMKK
ncbi:unnamed protein product [Phyllotreta striolata]|uniref:ENTH domain-containing protein n=1 Tax=Phyllotreta striolata TaxID=444603 RepID=A0A9N9TUJ0_PHYSR|nr:unnamed protein product [Phyllotreta striolata]